MEKEDNSYHKINLNWYPGHMAKTKREIIEDLKLIDVVIELLDSRIPIASRNPDIAEITKNKDRIIVLNKSDLSDPKENAKWIQHFKSKGQVAIECDSNSGHGVNEVLRAIEKIKEKELQEYAKKGRTGRKIRAMILGIPNVGKSSFINRVSKASRLEVGNKEIAYELLKFLLKNYKNNVSERYKISEEHIEEILNRDEPENYNIYEIMLEIGKKRGAIISGGQVDDEKVARIILDDFRSGKIGKITLERCEK